MAKLSKSMPKPARHAHPEMLKSYSRKSESEKASILSMLGFGTCMCAAAGAIMFFCLRKDRMRQPA